MMVTQQVLTVAQMQAAEQALMDDGISVDELMLRAGKGAADWVWRAAAGSPVTVLCGPGNNGGDGYVIAESLRRRGLQVQVVAPIEPKTEAATYARNSFAGSIATAPGDGRNHVFVDCLFGSGLSRPLSPELVLTLRDLASRHHFRIAVDLPSAIQSDSGELLNEKLPRYDLTLALGAWKYAHWRLPAREVMGTVKLIPIGVGDIAGAARLLARPNIKAPPGDSHKYRRGLCVVIGGEMAGASILASVSAMRAGAGYVKLLAPQSHPSCPPGLVVDQSPLEDALADKRIDVMLVGPGLGRGNVSLDRLNSVLAFDRPTVVDADALMLLTPDMLRDRQQILATPHDGELDALCRSFSVLAKDRQAKAQALAKVSGMTILAKGPDTLVAAPDGQLAIAPPAPSWLSTAGTGDVLAGIAASRMAVGASPISAACEAIWLHSEAARNAGPAFTADGLAVAVSDAIAAAL